MSRKCLLNKCGISGVSRAPWIVVKSMSDTVAQRSPALPPCSTAPVCHRASAGAPPYPSRSTVARSVRRAACALRGPSTTTERTPVCTGKDGSDGRSLRTTTLAVVWLTFIELELYYCHLSFLRLVYWNRFIFLIHLCYCNCSFPLITLYLVLSHLTVSPVHTADRSQWCERSE